MGRFPSQQLISILKVAVPVLAAIGAAAYTYGYFRKSNDQEVTKDAEKAESDHQSPEKEGTKRQIDLATVRSEA